MVPTIVLADDEPTLRAFYADSLRRAGFEVREAADGHEVLACLAAQTPALLILDAWMPGLNGFEVLDALRHDPNVGEMKVVMLSNLTDADSQLEGFSGGLTDWWVKGLGLDELVERVRELLADRAMAPGQKGTHSSA